MNKFYILFFISIVFNIALYFWGDFWQTSYADQFIATHDIEKVLKKTGGDFSFENIKLISESTKSNRVAEIDASIKHMSYGADKKALMVNDTVLLFQNGLYFGSDSGRGQRSQIWNIQNKLIGASPIRAINSR